MHPQLINLFDRHRRRIRRALGWETLGRLVAALGCAFWVGLAIDWSLEPTVEVRLVLMLLAAVSCLVWLSRSSLRLWCRPLPNREVAQLVEANRPELAESLSTAVDLAESRETPSKYDPLLSRATTTRALDVLARTGEPSLINLGPARRWLSLACLLVGSVVVFGAYNSEALSFFGQRVALSTEPWPRRNHLVLEGFKLDEDGVWRRKIARGDSLDVTVLADLSGDYENPEQVWLRYEFQDGPSGREPFAKIGEPTKGERPHQLFRHTLSDIHNDAKLRVRGGDYRIGPIEVVLAPRPVVVGVELEISPPGYLAKPTRRASSAATGLLPEGARVRVLAKTNKPISQASATWSSEAGAPVPNVSLEPNGLEVAIDAGVLTVDRVLLIELTDVDGIRSLQPHPVSLLLKPDTPPRVTLRLEGVRDAVTPEAKIGFKAEFIDDNALEDARIDLVIDSQPVEGDSLQMAKGQKRRQLEGSVDLLTDRFAAGLDAGRLQPGQLLLISASASDRYDLKPGERVTRSQRYPLEVVTHDQLLARIEAREVNLRSTFEQTLRDMRRIEAALKLQVRPSAEDDPEERPRRLRRARVLEDIAKVTQDTMTVAEAFDAIHLELIHNRIENDELLLRIKDRIARPLLEVGERGLPGLRKLIYQADSSENSALTSRDESHKLAKATAVKMETVLAEMRSLETYNEVLALLRQVIDEQQRVRRETDRARQEQFR